jgi:hypothetical protein
VFFYKAPVRVLFTRCEVPDVSVLHAQIGPGHSSSRRVRDARRRMFQSSLQDPAGRRYIQQNLGPKWRRLGVLMAPVQVLLPAREQGLGVKKMVHCSGLARRRTVVVRHLASFSSQGSNDIVIDGRGNAYVNAPHFDFATGPPADDLAFPNGMAVSADNRTLVIAESCRCQLTAFDIDIDDDGRSALDGLSLNSGRIRRTGSASTPKARSGTPTYRTSTACGGVKAVSD